MAEKHEPGLKKIERGACPLNKGSPAACMFCPYGHMTECHYPFECEEAECSHYQAEAEEEW